MKRKTARAEKAEKEEQNGVEENEGDDVEHEQSDDSEMEQTVAKKKKGSKRKTGSKKYAKNNVDQENDKASTVEDSKKKSNRKSVGKKTTKHEEYDSEQETADDHVAKDGGHEDAKKKKGGKRGVSEDPKKKKTNKRKQGRASKKGESDEEVSDQESEPEQKKIGTEKKSAKENDENSEQSSDENKENKDDEDGEDYEVEDIIDEKIKKGVLHYLIRWKGYGSDADTWESESTLDCPDIMKKFKELRGKKSNTSASTKKAPKSKKDKKKIAVKDTEVNWSSEDEFEVDRILEVHFKRNGDREFLVSWKGYPASQDSWEPEENLKCGDLITKFMDKVAAAKGVDSKDLRVKRVQTERFTLQMGGGSRRLSRRLGTKQRVHYHDAE